MLYEICNILHAVVSMSSPSSWPHLLVLLHVAKVSSLLTSQCPCLAVESRWFQVTMVWASIRLQWLRVRKPRRVLHAYSVVISSPLPSWCPYLAVRSRWFQVATVWTPNRSHRQRVRPPLTCHAYILQYT
jgi:hypothetical protein